MDAARRCNSGGEVPASLHSVTVLSAVVGSVAHGLATPFSDVDVMAVHMVPTERVLGLYGPAEVARVVSSTDPDRTSFELGKFVSLALRANPTMLELLWADRFLVLTDEGRRLVAARDAFLATSTVRASYAGYVRSQLAALTVRGDGSFSSATRRRTAKHARHCRRLLIHGTQLLTSGSMRLDVGEFRGDVFSAGELAVTDVVAFTERVDMWLGEFAGLDSVLADEPDIARVEELLVGLRVGALAHLSDRP